VLSFILSFGHSLLVNRQKHAHQTGGRLLFSLSLGHSVLVNWVEMGFVDWVLRWIVFGWVEIGFVCASQTVENARYKVLGINP